MYKALISSLPKNGDYEHEPKIIYHLLVQCTADTAEENEEEMCIHNLKMI